MNRTGVFLVLCAFAALAACGQRISPASDVVPAAFPAPHTFDAAKMTHAPCAISAPLHSPVKGTPPIVVAFGELRMTSSKVRYAFPGVAFAYHGGKYVFAATSGKATYFANVTGLGPAIVIRTQSGVETLYAGFGHAVKAFLKTPHRKVKAGQVIAIAGAQPLLFEYALTGNVLGAGTQTNPCGSGSDSASGTISVMPAVTAVYARFHTLEVDGTPLPPVTYSGGSYPAGSPDVATPAILSVANVVVAHSAAATVYEHSDVFSDYYVVLCGNVVFATGPARYHQFAYPHPTSSPAMPLASPSLPPLVFFRDAGELGKTLTAPLPAPYNLACPAPAPANFYLFTAPVFNQVGQQKYVYYTANTPAPGSTSTPLAGDTVTFSASDADVVTVNPVSPSPLPVFATAPPVWPPPGPRGHITAAAVGTATITVTDSSCACPDAPIAVTVNPTPTPAEIPTPIPN